MSAGAEDARGRALASVDTLVEAGGEADETLREVVRALGSELYAYAAIAFVEEGELVAGPAHGSLPDAGGLVAFPVRFDGAPVAELHVAPAGADDRPFLERVAERISPLCLVGWDTGGAAWDDL